MQIVGFVVNIEIVDYEIVNKVYWKGLSDPIISN